jgi:hypothetical protein
MLRARLPLAVATVAAGIALIPMAAASAATPLDGTPLGGLITQLQSGGSSLSGGSGSAPDVGGDLTTFASCLQAAPNATASATPTTTSTATSTATPTPTPTTSTPTIPLVQSQGSSSSASPNALTTQAATVPDPLSPILTAGQKCVENLLAGLGVTQAQCFSANGFDATTLSNVVTGALSGSAPDSSTLQNDLTGLLACLQGGTPSTASGGGGADTTSPTPTAVVSSEAPAAVAVTGTPNFTG